MPQTGSRRRKKRDRLNMLSDGLLYYFRSLIDGQWN